MIPLVLRDKGTILHTFLCPFSGKGLNHVSMFGCGLKIVSPLPHIIINWLGRRSVDDERQINRWKGRFKGKLVKMIKDANSRLDDYSISPKIRQILLHLGYELTD